MYFYVYNQAVERGDHVEINISQVNLKVCVCKQKHPITSSFYHCAPFPTTWTFSVLMQFLFHFRLVENVKMHDGKFGMNIILVIFFLTVYLLTCCIKYSMCFTSYTFNLRNCGFMVLRIMWIMFATACPSIHGRIKSYMKMSILQVCHF